jgi:mercuric ion binding protein
MIRRGVALGDLVSRYGRNVRQLALILGASASAALVLLAVSSCQRPEASAGRDTVRSDVRIAARARDQATDTARVVLDIKGMYCVSCEEIIRAMLMRTAGVSRAEVSAKRNRATVTFDPTQASPAAILAAVTSLGYDARIHRGEASGTGAGS